MSANGRSEALISPWGDGAQRQGGKMSRIAATFAVIGYRFEEAEAWGFGAFAAIPGARAFAFGPPPLPGYGNVSGFTMQLQDRSGGSIQQLADYVKQLKKHKRYQRDVY